MMDVELSADFGAAAKRDHRKRGGQSDVAQQLHVVLQIHLGHTMRAIGRLRIKRRGGKARVGLPREPSG
ncbi:protein of unknown function (plasmid) [Shinella sp. WSC3-e]|nr:hypothetical protein SHINE37_100118 [Rhizobiaceae bacterium]CAK7261662.1 protein of unknown function [Shinella sp. WSC3-e]